MNILVIDGMGGGIGKSIIEHIKSEITNAVIFNCAKADFIIGVTGIILANAMHWELSPVMAAAVSSSSAL